MITDPFTMPRDDDLDRAIDAYELARRGAARLDAAYRELVQALNSHGNQYVRGGYLYALDPVSELWRQPVREPEHFRKLDRPRVHPRGLPPPQDPTPRPGNPHRAGYVSGGSFRRINGRILYDGDDQH